MQVLSSLLLFRLSLVTLIVTGWFFKFSENSFITQEQAIQSFRNAILEAENLPINALINLYKSFCLFETYEAVLYADWFARLLGDDRLSIPHQEVCQKSSIIEVKDTIYLDNVRVVEAVTTGHDFEATRLIIADLLLKHPCHFETLFNAGVHAVRFGFATEAILMYEKALACNPVHTKSLLNLASVYQSYGEYDAAIDLYRRGIAIEGPLQSVLPDRLFVSGDHIGMRINLPLAFFQRGALNEAIADATSLSQFLSQIILEAQHQGVDSTKVQDCFMFNYANLLLIGRGSLFWNNWEVLHHQVLNYTIWKTNVAAKDDIYPGPLLPFESLMIDESLSTRLLLAQSASHIAAKRAVTSENIVVAHSSSTMRANVKSLVIGFFSCDFGDHPTSHLLLGLFANIHRLRQQQPGSWYDRVSLFIYSFGKTNDSPYQQHFRQWADRYYDMLEWSQQQIIHQLAIDRVDVLLEMQLHTLGNRLEIVAQHPVPSIVNYLVYPGTSGATFIDYLFCDSEVVPPEQARFYSEKLIYVPASYQISSYEFFDLHRIDTILNRIHSLEQVIVSQRIIREELSLPEAGIIFANFNKIDKIEPKTMTVWMNILTRFPSAYIWLLLPSEESSNPPSIYSSRRQVLLSNLYQYAALFGVNRKRILIADKTSKPEHIYRHLAADLFLDTLIYGAHSTATDALRGALPVLTMTGETFPSRVVTSLYASFVSTSENSVIAKALSLLMATDSVKSFEDQAVRLAEAPRVLQRMKLKLIEQVRRHEGLFNATQHDVRLLTTIAAIKESKENHIFQHREKRWNLIQRST